MTIMNDKQILDECRGEEVMVMPYVTAQVRFDGDRKLISYGPSSFGYDVRVADEFRIALDEDRGYVLDPKDVDDDLLPTDPRRRPDGAYIVPPHGFVLCRTVEYLRIPDDVMVVAVGKSTYARVGLIANVTPLEPGWEGNITIELSNTTGLPVVVYPNEGIVQLLFFRGSRPRVTYAERGGKYQGQTGITMAKA